MRTIRLSIALAALLLAAGSAHAFAITWVFQNTLFDDGTTLTGSFQFDADIGGADGFSNINLATADGRLKAADYTGDPIPTSSDIFLGAVSGKQVLGVNFADAMTNAGGTVDIASGWLSAELGLSAFAYRLITSGSIVGTAVSALASPTVEPVQLVEPAILTIFVLGLTGIAVLRLSRRRVTI